jgi:hypothetical protein
LNDFSVPELFIDKDGHWYADGVQIIRKEIIKLFASNLRKDDQHNYYIYWQEKSYPVKVEDVPFFAEFINEQAGRLVIQLYDSRELSIIPKSLILKNNIPYLSLFWERDTKLSHHSYWEISKNLTERNGNYFIKYGNNELPIEELT